MDSMDRKVSLENLSFQEVLNEICRLLPEDWGVDISLEKDAGDTKLLSPEGVDIDFPSDRECVLSTLEDAVEFAIDEDAKRKTPNESLFFLQNQSMGYVGNFPYWWLSSGGYGPVISEAKKFTEQEADSMIRSSSDSHRFAKWPVDQVLGVACHVVDSQLLNRKWGI